MTSLLPGTFQKLTELERRVSHLESLAGVTNREPAKGIEELVDRINEVVDDVANLTRKDEPHRNFLDYLKAFRFSLGDGRTYVQTNISGPSDYDRLFTSCDEAVSAIASCLAHTTRVKIVKCLLEGDKTAAEITEATQLCGGPLYHHLSHLTDAEFIHQDKRGVYSLTTLGLDTSITILFESSTKKMTVEASNGT